MANRVLTIVAKVKDAASAVLNTIQNNLKKTGDAAKQTSMDFTKFNRIMFATTAYAGLFAKGFQKIGDSLLEGASFDRVVGQFERVMGPKGDLFKAISGFTDNSIDKVEALKAGIQIKTLGIANSTADVAELISRAGTASKLAGMDSAEGIKKFTQFLKDGSVANLEFLNLIRSNDPGLKLQMALIGKMGGVLGGAMTAQAKYGMGLKLLRAATDGAMKGQRDLYDVMADGRQAFSLLKNELGVFLGTALSSLLDKLTRLVDRFSTVLEYVRTTKKEILFLVKAFTVAAGAVAGFMATFGTLRLIALGLKALGVSAAPIIFGITAIVGLFSALTYKVKEGTSPVERFTEKLRVFSAVLKGVYQLVSSFITSQDNMRKGIGKIDKDLYELLNKNGLFIFVHRVSKVIAIFSNFVIETFKQLYSWGIALDEVFGSLGHKVAKIFGVDKKLNVDLEATGNVIDEPSVKRLSAIWLNANSRAYGFLKKGAAALLASFMAYKLLGIGKGFLSNVPLLGKLFKGAAGPNGTKTNPIHVIVDKGFAGTLKQGILDSILGKSVQGPVAKGAVALGRVGGMAGRAAAVGRSAIAGTWMTFAPLLNSANILSKAFFSTTGIFTRGFGALGLRLAGFREIVGTVIASFNGLSKGAALLKGFQIVHLVLFALGSFAGIVQGIANNLSSFSGLFSAAYDYIRSTDYAQLFSDLYQSIRNTLSGVGDWISQTFSTVYDLVSNAILAALAPLDVLGKYLYMKLVEGFGIIAPYMQGVLNFIGESFSTFRGWLDIVTEGFKTFYKWLIELPGVGKVIQATTESLLNPLGTMKDFFTEGIGAAGSISDMGAEAFSKGTAKNLLDQAQGGKGKLALDPESLSADARLDYVNKAINQASEIDRSRMVNALKEATAGTSAGDAEITADEFARIFGFALDNSKISKHTKETAVEIKDKKRDLNSRRGGC